MKWDVMFLLVSIFSDYRLCWRCKHMRQMFSLCFCFSGLCHSLPCLGVAASASALPPSPSALPLGCLGPGLLIPRFHCLGSPSAVLPWPLPQKYALTTSLIVLSGTKWCFCIPVLSHTHTHTCLTAHFPRLPGWAGTRKVKPIWILLKQETVSGSGITWAICKYAPRSRQTTMPAPHHSVLYRPDALPAAQPTAWKHWK